MQVDPRASMPGFLESHVSKRRDGGEPVGLGSAALQSGCRAGLQTCTPRPWQLGSRQYSRSGDRRYNLRVGSQSCRKRHKIRAGLVGMGFNPSIHPLRAVFPESVRNQAIFRSPLIPLQAGAAAPHALRS
jgi:hypothetical protein